MSIGKVFESTIVSEYHRYCRKSCAVVWSMDSSDEEYNDRIYKKYCENCIIKSFLKNGLGIDID